MIVFPSIIYLTISICYIETKFKNVINKWDGNSPSYGLCQVKLETARRFDKSVTKKKLMKIEYNYDMAKTYLIYQLLRYNFDLRKAISAYNAGSARTCNKKYVDKVLTKYNQYMNNRKYLIVKE